MLFKSIEGCRSLEIFGEQIAKIEEGWQISGVAINSKYNDSKMIDTVTLIIERDEDNDNIVEINKYEKE